MSASEVSYWCFCLPSVSDHFCFRFGANAELHRPRPLVCNLPPSDVQEHSQAGPQEYRYNLGCILCHHDPSSRSDGEQQPAAWANQQDQLVYSVWWTLGRLVFKDLPQATKNIDELVYFILCWHVRSLNCTGIQASVFHFSVVKSQCCHNRWTILWKDGVVENLSGLRFITLELCLCILFHVGLMCTTHISLGEVHCNYWQQQSFQRLWQLHPPIFMCIKSLTKNFSHIDFF